MAGFGVIAYIIIWPLLALSVIQFGFHLFEGIPNARLVSLSNQFIAYLLQIFDYLSYKTDQKPFPFSSLPSKNILKQKLKKKQKLKHKNYSK